ncbi:hypothetical protein [Chryseobacterium sp. 3008163]|uniref:hypothetical protein n=1 Tax=Chryseobacterium sp. 3008163 TaxID=2478663 RepID=UPI000F0C28AE|nr:hypothetical protein [Chryseobacterium sp. 3008163]AYN01985.1 hypothetical protein EAG08_18315 [Chryseobacterium sp. 3008163]
MNTADLKIDIIKQINSITDKVRLEDLLQLLKFQTEKSVYITDEEEKNAIAEARNEIAEGKVHYSTDFKKILMNG